MDKRQICIKFARDGISESEVPFLFFKAADRVQGLFASKLWFLSDSTMPLWYYSTTI